MKDAPLCDKPGCLETAAAMIAIRYAQRIGVGYWCCAEHEAECFWQVTKVGLKQNDKFDVVLLDPQQVEDLRISRA